MKNEMVNRVSDMSNWFNNTPFFNDFGSLPKVNMRSDISETKDSYTLKVDIPDMDKKDIKLSYNDGILTVSGKRDSFSDHEDKEGNILMSERSYGSFSRSYRLNDVDEEKINAKYNNGTLKVVLPKTDKVEEDNEKFIKIN